MKKLLQIGVAVIIASAMFVSQTTAAKNDKVDICHVISANDVILFLGVLNLHFGKVISISGNAVDAHLAHGDNTIFFQNETSIPAFRAAGAHLPAANCWVAVVP